jgi:O-antigen ligase
VAGWCAAAVVVATAAAVDPAGFRPFTTLRWAVIGVVVAVAAAASGRTVPSPARPLAYVWVALLGWTALATIVALDPLVAFVGHPRRHLGLVGWLVGGLAFVAGARLTPDERRVHLGRAIVVAAAVTGTAAIAERLGWDPMGVRFGNDRTGGLLGQPVYLGALAVLLAPAAFGIATARTSFGEGWRRAAAVAGAGCTIAVVLSGTRGAWLGAAVAAALVGRPLLRWAKEHRLATAGVLVLAVGLALAASVGSRTATLFDPAINGGQGRTDEWHLALEVVADHPVTGAGPEGYRIAVLGHVDDAYARRHGRDEVVDRAHNAVLDVATTAGLPAAALYVWLLMLVLVRCAKVLRDQADPTDPADRADPADPTDQAGQADPTDQADPGDPADATGQADRFVAGIALGLVAWIVQLQVSFPVAEIDPLAWLLAGTLAAGAGPSPPRRVWVQQPLRLAAGVVAVVLAAAGLRAVVADRDLDRAEHVLADGRPSPAVRAADQATARRPDDVDAWYVAARVASAGPGLLAVDAGLDRVEQGLDRSPRDPALGDLHEELLVERALRSGLPDDLRAARRAAEERIAADPANGVHHRRLAQVLAAQGHTDRAVTALRRATELDPDDRAARQALAALEHELEHELDLELPGSGCLAPARHPEPGTRGVDDGRGDRG